MSGLIKVEMITEEMRNNTDHLIPLNCFSQLTWEDGSYCYCYLPPREDLKEEEYFSIVKRQWVWQNMDLFTHLRKENGELLRK